MTRATASRSAPCHRRSATVSRSGTSSRSRSRSRQCKASRRPMRSELASRSRPRTEAGQSAGSSVMRSSAPYAPMSAAAERNPSRARRDPVGPIADRPNTSDTPKRSITVASVVTRRRPRSSTTTRSPRRHWNRSTSVGRAHHDLLGARFGGVPPGSRRQQFVGLKAARRPDRDAEGAQHVSGERRLGGDETFVRRRFRAAHPRHDRIEGDRHVRDGGSLTSAQNVANIPRAAPNSCPPAPVARGVVEAADQLVGAVDEADPHRSVGGGIRRSRGRARGARPGGVRPDRRARCTS